MVLPETQTPSHAACARWVWNHRMLSAATGMPFMVCPRLRSRPARLVPAPNLRPFGKAHPRGLLMNLSDHIESRREQHLQELCEFLHIPSISAKSEHKPDIERAAKWVAGNLRGAGFKTVEIVPTHLHPLVYAESLEAPGKPTILFYGHYDVQPPEPLDLWTSPP